MHQMINFLRMLQTTIFKGQDDCILPFPQRTVPDYSDDKMWAPWADCCALTTENNWRCRNFWCSFNVNFQRKIICKCSSGERQKESQPGVHFRAFCQSSAINAPPCVHFYLQWSASSIVQATYEVCFKKCQRVCLIALGKLKKCQHHRNKFDKLSSTNFFDKKNCASSCAWMWSWTGEWMMNTRRTNDEQCFWQCETK